VTDREFGLRRRTLGSEAAIIAGMQTEGSRLARILVLYHSTSGNTKLMADLVAEGAASVCGAAAG
jgi:hypothetical protein